MDSFNSGHVFQEKWHLIKVRYHTLLCTRFVMHFFNNIDIHKDVSTIPLYRRIIRSDQQSIEAMTGNVQSLSTCRRVWNKGEEQKQMDLALCEIADGKMTYRKAAIAYGIPSTIM